MSLFNSKRFRTGGGFLGGKILYVFMFCVFHVCLYTCSCPGVSMAFRGAPQDRLTRPPGLLVKSSFPIAYFFVLLRSAAVFSKHVFVGGSSGVSLCAECLLNNLLAV